MSEIIPEKPQFQIIVNSDTGRTSGRIYFSKLYICQHTETLKSWLKQKRIYFTQKDVKLYKDGSFRLYFEAPQSEYEILKKLGVESREMLPHGKDYTKSGLIIPFLKQQGGRGFLAEG